MNASLRPHAATYVFMDRGGAAVGTDVMEVARRPEGWLVSSHLQLESPERLTSDVEWHLEPDLGTRVLYVASTDHWDQEHHLEAAVTGNGLIVTRSGAEGPTQVEMGWGPEVQLDHLAACFTTVMLARLGLEGGRPRRVTTVYIGADDLLPEPLEQEYRVLPPGEPPPWGPPAGRVVERLVPGSGARALVSVLEGGVVAAYEGLFRVEDWRFTVPVPA